MRQIAHEILRTIDPGMPPTIPAKPEGGFQAIGMQLTVSDGKPGNGHPSVTKVGRNQPLAPVEAVKNTKYVRLRSHSSKSGSG